MEILIMKLKDLLKQVKLENKAENKILTAAIQALDNGVYEPKVLKELKIALQQLATKKELSKSGIKLYTEISKPSFNLDSDLANSSMTWF